MTKKEMSIDSALHNPESAEGLSCDRERMLRYKKFAAAFSYPDDNFFKFFPDTGYKREILCLEYDRLFRANEVWLYGSEYKAENEFQRVNDLSDISGFYKAFGLSPDKDRPDSLRCELEFMYYIIFKKLHALEGDDIDNRGEKVYVCADTQKKFFNEHLYPAAKKIGKKIISKAKDKFYAEAAKELLGFLESERRFFESD